MAYGRDDFESIVRTHQAMVFSIAHNFFHSVPLAEEVAQDVFLQLYEHGKTIESPAHLTSWLRRTTAHRCIDVLRRREMRSEIQMDELPELGEERSEPDPLRDDKVRRLVASLPEKQKLCVILRYGEDMDALEIAETLNIPVATVRSHLQRALSLLRAKASGLGVIDNGSL